MSQALHIGFQSDTEDAGRAFFNRAADLLDLDELVGAFGRAIAVDGAAGHMCCAVGDDGRLHAVFGESPGLADRAGEPGIEAIAVTAPDGALLTVLIASAAPIERHQLSRWRLAANIYVTHAVTLLDARDDAPTIGLTAIERQCLSLTRAGQSYLDIAEALGRSAPAIGVHVRRAMARLGTASLAGPI